MVRTTIIPNRNIIFAPFKTNLDIVVLCQKIQEVIQNKITLVFRHIIDMSDMVTYRKHRFPPRNGVGADDLVLTAVMGLFGSYRVYCFEDLSHIFRCATRCRMEFKTMVVGTFEESRLRICSS